MIFRLTPRDSTSARGTSVSRLCVSTTSAASIAISVPAPIANPVSAAVSAGASRTYYLDEAGVLSEAVEGEIFFSNELLYEACGAQIVVAVLRTTGDAGVDKYSYDLFNSWGIGDAKANNGFLLLLSTDQEDYYARTGIGLEKLMSNETVAKYLDDYLEADFAAGRYDEGVRCFFEHVLPSLLQALLNVLFVYVQI